MSSARACLLKNQNASAKDVFRYDVNTASSCSIPLIDDPLSNTQDSLRDYGSDGETNNSFSRDLQTSSPETCFDPWESSEMKWRIY